MVPSIGRILHYRLSASDVERIEFARTGDIRRGGNKPREGDIVPLIAVKIWPDEYAGNHVFFLDSAGNRHVPKGPVGVNGQAILDGNDTVWVTSASEGEGPGQWSWPPRV